MGTWAKWAIFVCQLTYILTDYISMDTWATWATWAIFMCWDIFLQIIFYMDTWAAWVTWPRLPAFVFEYEFVGKKWVNGYMGPWIIVHGPMDNFTWIHGEFYMGPW